MAALACSTRSYRPLRPSIHLRGANSVRRNSNASDGEYQNATSNHPGGCNFLFCDGSVHFVKSTVAITTYWALGTQTNGEVLSSDSY